MVVACQDTGGGGGGGGGGEEIKHNYYVGEREGGRGERGEVSLPNTSP